VASDGPPTLTQTILSSPEVVTVERTLAAVLERSRLSADDLFLASDPDTLDLLPAVYVRWQQQVVQLDSSSCGLSVDGTCLLVVSVPILDVPVLVMALKSRLLDLCTQQDEEDGEEVSSLEIQMISRILVLLESLLS